MRSALAQLRAGPLRDLPVLLDRPAVSPTELGGRHVDAGRVAATLWPDAEGDEARDALKALLHRSRALFGAEMLVVRDGQIAFDERVTWLDTWAFEYVSGRIETLLGAGATAYSSA